MLIKVVFPLPGNRRYTYTVPVELRASAQIGCRVLAPFGRRVLTGFVIETDVAPLTETKMRPILDILDEEPVISGKLLTIANWMADYYLCGLGEAIRTFLPAGLMLQSQKVARLGRPLPDAESSIVQRKIIATIAKHGTIRVDRLKKLVGSRGFYSNLSKLGKNGHIEIFDELIGRKSYEQKVKHIKIGQPISESDFSLLKKRSPRQAQMLQALKNIGGIEKLARLCEISGSSSQTARALEKKKFVEIFDRVILRDFYGELQVPQASPIVLNQEQKAAVTAIRQPVIENRNATFLLLGVTGSGKTQVYIEVLRQAIEMGKGAIVLVPEIALTPQTVFRFRSEFQKMVSVIHSRMSKSERFAAWTRIRNGESRVVVGPRSAILAPVQNLGLIVVDEEQESSYKQSDKSPRYHGRDLAVIRGKFENAVVILGSATPSLESYYNAKTGKYNLIELKKRIADIPLPRVTTIDMSRERIAGSKKGEIVLSRKLLQKIEEKLQRKEQIILLQNRRGYSTVVQCGRCGEVEMCPNCNISLSFHQQGNVMRCHYCNFADKLPRKCSVCNSEIILQRGVGTQQVQSILQKQFPLARIVRMDMDTTRRKHAHDKILNDFGDAKYDILLGTQMIAKGLDFENVTLVGVISADTGLFLPDFRATERTFQLLTQVAGRAGRKNGQGEVIIQTFSPQHMSIQFASKHDYFNFAHSEIRERQALDYPPSARLALLHFSDKEEKKASQAARKFAFLLSEKEQPLKVVGPAPAALSRLKEMYRYQLVIKSDKRRDPGAQIARRCIEQCRAEFADGSDLSRVKIRIDIDPVMIL